MSMLNGIMRRKEQLEDWLPWLLPLDADQEIIMTATGGLLCVAQLELPDFESSSPESLDAHHHVLKGALERVGDGWAVWMDQWRVAAPTYLPYCDFGGNLAAQLIDASRRAQFTELDRPVFSNSMFFAIHYQPLQRDALLGWMMERPDAGSAAHIKYFKEQTSGLFEQLRQTMPGLIVLHGDVLASYLESSVSYRPKYTMFPTGVIRQQLAAWEWTTEPALAIDGLHLLTVEVRNYGPRTALTVDCLHELPFECRWVVTMHGLDPETRRKAIEGVRKSWLAKQKGIGALITEALTKNPFAGRTNPEADRALDMLENVLADVEELCPAYCHANIHVWGDTPEEAYERAQIVAGKLNGRGLLARIATLNSTLAPIADMPGQVDKEMSNVRRSLEEIGGITRVAPVTGVSTGCREDWRFNGPALLVGNTRRGVPLYWSLNANGRDKAHTAIIGQTGGGKSVLLGLMAAQFLKYPNASVALFDRLRSFMVTCLALGGDWIELGSGGVGVQPLRHVDQPSEFAWAHDWLVDALRIQHFEVLPHVKASITEGLKHVADLQPDERTLTRFCNFLGADRGARDAMLTYLAGGAYGLMFDGVIAGYGDSPVIGIETSNLDSLKIAAPLAMAAMFRAIHRDRLAGRDGPKMLIVDEFGTFMKDPDSLFSRQIELGVREYRKLNVAMVLASQDLLDYDQPHTKVIFNQLGTRIFLPHQEASRASTAEQYARAGLLPEQIYLIAHAISKSEYLLQTDDVTRLISLRLEGDALRICGAASPMDHRRARALLAEGVKPGEEFCKAWLSEPTKSWVDRISIRAVAA
jgi:type IV secretion system protein VirB4